MRVSSNFGSLRVNFHKRKCSVFELFALFPVAKAVINFTYYSKKETTLMIKL